MKLSKNTKKKILIYAASMLIPTLIFFIAATINGFVPLGKELLNSYDSFNQYSGMLLEYARLLREGNIFYSWGAGLGFNFFGTLTYYGMSPLNLFSLLASPENYHMFFAFITFARFMLLGGSMCFYLSHKEVKPLYIVLFSTIYALMGYTSTYYYNYIWIDSVIMLPLIIHGLDKLLDGKSPCFYIVTLAITIMINYYIGYMICIFCVIWYLYRLINIEDKKKITFTFFTSSLLAGLISAVTLLPSFFALMTGKGELYTKVNYRYFGVSRNVFTFFYTMTTGAYQATDQSYGPALIYVTIMTIVLNFFYFFNKKFSKKEKIATFIIMIFFYLSFSINFLNYAWQFFQRPVWWQSRFSFLFSFFLITVAVKTLMNIHETEFNWKFRALFVAFGTLAILIGAYFKWQVILDVKPYTIIFLGLSILIMIEMFTLLDKKAFLTLLIAITFIDLSINTYNSLKGNFRYKSYTDYQYLKEDIPSLITKLDEENDNFYRFELMDDYTSDDGLYFGYHGINYFSSVRNMKVTDLFERLGVTVYDLCHIELAELDPVVLSLLDVKYIYGNDSLDYLDKIENNLYENPYALGLGFLGKSDIKDIELESGRPIENKTKILMALTGLDKEVYKLFTAEDFDSSLDDFYSIYKVSFTADRDYLLMPEFEGNITIDDKEQRMDKTYITIASGSKVEVEYRIVEDFKKEEIFLALLDLDNYEEYMDILKGRDMKSEVNTGNTTILKANITSDDVHDYLFTSIEYERGMKVFLDGNETEPDLVLGTLIGLHLSPGEHEIEIKYVPRGFIAGAIVTTISLVATVFYLQRRKKVI